MNGIEQRLAKFTGKHLYWRSYLNNETATLLQKRRWHRCFPVNSAKSSKTAIL